MNRPAFEIPYDLDSPKALKMYETYSKKYDAAKKKRPNMWEEKLSINSYLHRYNAFRVSQDLAIRSGKKKGRTNIADAIVRGQKTLLTGAEIRNWARFAKQEGFKGYTKEYLSNIKSRKDLKELGDFIKISRNAMKEEHPEWTSQELSHWVSHEFFGSP